MLENFLISYPPPQLFLLFLVGLVAGTARGFSGFGGALIFVPLASALSSPQMAAPILLIIDTLMTLPMLPDAVASCKPAGGRHGSHWCAGRCTDGYYAAGFCSPIVLRWCITGIVLCLLAFLVSGWRYNGKPKTGLSIGTGMVAASSAGSRSFQGHRSLPTGWAVPFQRRGFGQISLPTSHFKPSSPRCLTSARAC